MLLGPLSAPTAGKPAGLPDPGKALIIILALGLAACQAAPEQPPEAEARNVVVFCIDTLRADHVGAYGYARDTSPNIDALAARGVRFEDALALAPWTLPSSATLLTSLEPWRHGAETQGASRDLDHSPPVGFRPGVQTLAQVLRSRGFRTALLSPNPFLELHLPFGFDFVRAGKRASAEVLVAQALGWIREKPRRRFFLYFQFMDLHQPIRPPEPYFSHFPVDEGGERGERHEDWQFQKMERPDSAEFLQYRAHKLALYDGALRYVDAQIGVFLEQLGRLGLEDRTLFIVTSDHGEEFWDHAELERELGGDPRGFWGIGHGHALFQELLHVPLVLAGPRVAEGRRVDCGVTLLDVAPTLLELLGGKATPRMRGRSLTPWLGEANGTPCPSGARIAGSVAYGPEAWAVQQDGEKLITRSDGSLLLYDLRADPLERRNLAQERPERVARLKALLAEAEEGAPPPRRTPAALPPEVQEQMRALGYLGD